MPLGEPGAVFHLPPAAKLRVFLYDYSGQKTQYVTVLEILLVESPQTAAKAAIAADLKKGKT
jgi:hypothetical protein